MLGWLDQCSVFKILEKSFVLLSYIMSEVEEGAVYQIEDVWDGTQWHKSKKTLPDEAGDAEGTLISSNMCA